MVTVKVEVEKELELPEVKDVHGHCLSNSDITCNLIDCQNCIFCFDNYKALLEEQKGG